MNITQLLLSFLAGAAAGSLYFTGLWYTVRRLPEARHPALLLLASFVLRLALLLGTIYLLAGAHWSYLISAVAGLLLARTLLIRRWGPENGERPTTNSNRIRKSDEPYKLNPDLKSKMKHGNNP
jgi:F1F0 ATPase subunit 2